MPLAEQKYSAGNRRPPGCKNRSPIGGCWILDRYYPFRWWLPAGTNSYYVAWILNVDGIPFNYIPSNAIPQRVRSLGIYLGERRDGFLLIGRDAGEAGRTRVLLVTTSGEVVQRIVRGKLTDVPPAGPGYDSEGPPRNIQWTAGISTILSPNIAMPPNIGTYSYKPTVVEYEVGSSLLQRYRGLQKFILETRNWINQGLGSNPYRYFLNSISTIPNI